MAGKVLKSSLNKKSQMISNYGCKRYYYYWKLLLWYCGYNIHLSLFVWLAAGKLPAEDLQLENSNKLEGDEDNDRRGSTIATPHTF